MLGDSVNMSARLMQRAIGEPERKIICDRETFLSAQHKIMFRYYTKQMLKGKSVETQMYEPVFNLVPQFDSVNFPFKILESGKTAGLFENAFELVSGAVARG